MFAIIITVIGAVWGFYYYDLVPYLIGALIGELIVVELFCFKLLSLIGKLNEKIENNKKRK